MEFAIPSQVTGADAPEAAPEATPQVSTEGQNQEQPQDTQLFAGKFKSVDDLAKAYKELESKLGQQTQQKSLKDELEAPPEQQQQPQSLDMAPFQAEFSRDGKLSDKSYEALASKGLPKDLVDGYIAGQQALTAQAVNDITSGVGGPEAYQQMTEWAKGNLDAPDIQAYNEAIMSNNPARMKLAVKALQARYQESEGKSPSLTQGRSGGQNTGFASHQEMTAMQKDPRYLSGDPAFHAQFDAKLAASKF